MATAFKKFTLLFLLCLSLFSCKEERYITTKVLGKNIAIDSTLVSKQSINTIITPYKKQMVKEINTIISYTPKDLTRTDGALESSLGNLLADLTYERANPIFEKRTGKSIDFSLFNYGGLRAGIPAGNVTNKNAFELMPFENMLVVVELSGEKMDALISYLIKNDTAHPLSKHIQLVVTKKGYELRINNEPYDNSKSYFVLTSDYLQSGGDKMTFFKDPLQKISLEYKIRDAIIDYFKSVDTLQSNLDQRFIKK